MGTNHFSFSFGKSCFFTHYILWRKWEIHFPPTYLFHISVNAWAKFSWCIKQWVLSALVLIKYNQTFECFTLCRCCLEQGGWLVPPPVQDKVLTQTCLSICQILLAEQIMLELINTMDFLKFSPCMHECMYVCITQFLFGTNKHQNTKMPNGNEAQPSRRPVPPQCAA